MHEIVICEYVDIFHICALSLSLSLSLTLSLSHTQTYTHTHTYVYIYIYQFPEQDVTQGIFLFRAYPV